MDMDKIEEELHLSRNWYNYSNIMRPDLSQVYLVPKWDDSPFGGKSGKKAHIWNGMDALCKKYSNHSELHHLYQVMWLDDDTVSMMYLEDEICKNCKRHENQEYNRYMEWRNRNDGV